MKLNTRVIVDGLLSQFVIFELVCVGRGGPELGGGDGFFNAQMFESGEWDCMAGGGGGCGGG